MNIQIQRAEIEDAHGIAALLRSLVWFAHIKDETPQMTQERVARHLTFCNSDSSHSVFVAKPRAGEIVGYSAVHWLPYLILTCPEGYVSELFVHVSYRSEGFGRQLLEAMKAEAQERGCSRLMLINLRKRESYQRRFYQKQGWKEREEAANFVYHLVERH
jgi:GNAT superfamily N-acetyltransferase